MRRRLIVIAGPTASGKTALSIAVAKHFKAEIFSADARQFYRGMDIGTAKATQAERSAVPHHFLDILDPIEDYTAGRYAHDLRKALGLYYQEHDTAVLVGGSGFYIKAAIEGVDDLPCSSHKLREKWKSIANEEGIEGLQRRLKESDPVYYEQVDIHNLQRVQRALEAIDVSGKPFSELRTMEAESIDANVAAIWLNPPRETLYERINERVDQMMKAGLLDEVKAFQPLKENNALQTVGYRELFDYMDGSCTFEQAVEKIKQHTRNYAKRQVTWFKKQNGFHAVENLEIDSIIRHLEHELNV